MFTPETSRHFEKYTDPSGVVSYILDTRIAPAQKCFYFVNPSMSADGRYFWFHGCYPPADGTFLACLDFETDEIHPFYETWGAPPSLIEPDGSCVFCNTRGIWRRCPDPSVPCKQISPVPEEVRCGGYPVLLSTHITYTADGKEFFLASITGSNHLYSIGTLNVETGKYTLWCHPDRLRNHDQANPVYNDIMLFAEDHMTDPETGASLPIRTNPEDGVYERLWIMRRGEKAPERITPMGNYATHEWWSSDGKWVYYCSGAGGGVCGHNIFTGEDKLIYACRPWHSHSAKDSTAFVNDEVLYDPGCDRWYRGCPSKVSFWNAETGKYLDIVTRNPAYNTPENPNPYHMDPHPRFNAGDRYITSTTTVRGGLMDCMITPAEQLFAMTR